MWKDFFGALIIVFGGSAIVAFGVLVSRFWKNRNVMLGQVDHSEVPVVNTKTNTWETKRGINEHGVDTLLRK